ncbi:WbuC family cupin fold metalloprotein [Tardiphaga sp. P5_C10]
MTTGSARLTQLSPEIIYSDGGYFAADISIVDMLKEKAATAPRRRCRLCFHANSDAAQQEMLIVMHKSSYVRPHRHIGKLETLMVIEGISDTLLFDETGRVTETSAMSPPTEAGHFFYRMPDRLFHSLIFRSEWFVFLETTIGPFDRTMTEVAEWAPPETDMAAGHAYLGGLSLPDKHRPKTLPLRS